ncbi:MAG TPA: IPT/TIG domain-containing protein [Nitrospira sp.]|nr:IPT/TIG domain-containing protein [Nitrospira sp.]
MGEKLTIVAAAISIGIMTLSLQIIDPGLTLAAEQQPKTKPHSKTVKPKAATPKTAKPKTAKPKTAEPKTVEPKAAEPKTAEPTTAEPKATEPTTAEPKVVQPNIEAKPQITETAANTAACFGIAPQIDELVPDEGEPGEQVTIKGAEFGTPDCLRGVSFGPGQASTFTLKDQSTISTTVPADGRKGLVMVTVTTASGEDSKVFLVK